MNKLSLVLLLIVMVNFSCKQRNNQHQNTTEPNLKIEEEAQLITVIADSINRDSCELVVRDFYSWYIKQELVSPTISFSADLKKYPNGYWALDVEKLKEGLTDFNYFSTAFIDFIIKRNQECNEAIQRDKLTDPDYILSLSNSTSKYCDFLFYDNWLGGQDAIEVKDFRIVNINYKVKKTLCIVYVESLTTYNDVYSKISIEVIKEKRGYKINYIEVKY